MPEMRETIDLSDGENTIDMAWHTFDIGPKPRETVAGIPEDAERWHKSLAH